MKYNFLNIFLDPKDLFEQAKSDINPFLLLNNTTKIEKIYEFYKSNSSFLYVSGFIGTGKAKIVDYSLGFLSTEAIVLKFNCFNSTVLDDILLSFFHEFKNLTSQNIISEPKIKTENFTQKINSYFSQIEKPFVIVLDSFEALLEENRPEILDFIFHLNSFDKVKTIIIGRTFESKYFEGVSLERFTVLALERENFDKYLKAEKIKAPSQIVDEFYKQTRGYYFFTALSIKLMKSSNLSLVELLANFEKSYLPFFDYLGKQVLTLIPPSERNMYWFLSLIRHPVNIDLLKKLNFYDEDKINFLVDSLLLVNDGSNLYVQDFLKDYADEAIATHIAQRIRQYIVDLYSTQLPLKPLERDVCISRQTMRKEIEYQKRFLPQRPKGVDNNSVDINYLSYSQVTDFGNKGKNIEPGDVKPKAGDTVKTQIDLTQRKNVSLNLENMSYQGKPAAKSTVSDVEQTEHEEEKISLKELLNLIRQAEFRYNFSQVIELCQKALLMKDDSAYQTNLPSVYVKIAYAFRKIADYESALIYFNLAKEVYEKAKDNSKVNCIKFNIAKIFFETYKIDMARDLFLEITKCSDIGLVVKSYLRLANLEESLSHFDLAFEYYKSAIAISDDSVDVAVLSEIYFKYALALDDKNDLKGAIKYYNMCINLGGDSKTNKFISSAYSNIATLYMEKNETENAVSSFKKAYDVDKQANNIEGMYYSASKIADALKRKKPDDAQYYFEDALDCAKLLKDPFYVISAALALGDFNYDNKQNEIALKNYLYANNLAKDNLSQDNIDKINLRINDIKFRLGVGKFDELVDIIGAQNNG